MKIKLLNEKLEKFLNETEEIIKVKGQKIL